MLQSPNKLKNYRLRWLSKTCKIWIPLNPNMFYNGCFWDTGRYFPTFFEFLTEFSQWFCCDFLLPNPLSMLAVFPFYSVILGFRVPLIPHLWLPGYQSPCYVSHSDSWFFLCFSYFSSFSPIFLNATCWLSISGCP